jgi:alpha-glucoside transport system permease protein
MPLQVNGLRLEVVGREITGRPVPGRPRRRAAPYLLALPAALLLLVLVIPLVRTAIGAFRVGDGFGLGNFSVLGDGSSLRAALHTAAWVVVALALVVVGFSIALAGHRTPALWRVLQPALTIPFALSAMVAGAAFRIIFDPTPERGAATALFTALFGSSPVWLGPGLVWLVLVSAFGWGWLGYVVSLFRAGLEAIPDDLARTVRAEGLRGWRRLRVLELPILRPTYRIIELTLLVAAVRLFDLVLIVATGPMQADADVLALHWWRTGRSDALALVLFVVVAALAMWRMRGLRANWAMPAPAATPRPVTAPPPPARRDRVLGLAVGIPVTALWAFPVLVLVLTALHSPAAAGLRGWWSPHGLGFASFGAAATAGLWHALTANAVIAVVATALVLPISVPAAYLLAWGGLPRRVVRTAVTVLAVLAVTPVQMYAGPLRDAFADSWLAGSPIGLGLVHAAAGVPFAVLLLRAAFAAAPASLVAEALLGPVRHSAVLKEVRQSFGPALVAVAVIELVLVWNDFIVGFLLGGPGVTPLSLVLWGQARQFATSAGTVAAAAVVSSILPVATLLALWPRVVRGLTIGAHP